MEIQALKIILDRVRQLIFSAKKLLVRVQVYLDREPYSVKRQVDKASAYLIKPIAYLAKVLHLLRVLAYLDKGEACLDKVIKPSSFKIRKMKKVKMMTKALSKKLKISIQQNLLEAMTIYSPM